MFDFWKTVTINFVLFSLCVSECYETTDIVKARSHSYEMRLLASSCPSVRMQQRDSQWKDFREIWLWGIL